MYIHRPAKQQLGSNASDLIRDDSVIYICHTIENSNYCQINTEFMNFTSNHVMPVYSTSIPTEWVNTFI